MIRWFTLCSVFCFLMAASAGDLFAQVNPYGNRPQGYAPGAEPVVDPRTRRANREKAVAIVGSNAHDFVETQGDEAVAAIFTCSKPVAEKLVEFHISGGLAKLPRPRELLRIIAQPRHGDDVAVWAIDHADELGDADSFYAYLSSPLDYALGLKQLAAGAAELQARRSHQTEVTATRPPGQGLTMLVGVGLLSFVGIVLWRHRQSSMA